MSNAFVLHQDRLSLYVAWLYTCYVIVPFDLSNFMLLVNKICLTVKNTQTCMLFTPFMAKEC